MGCVDVVGVLLAAGAGRRYGSPKVLAHGGAWLQAAVTALAEGGCAQVLVVLGAAVPANELRSAALTALRAATEAIGLDNEEESGAGARLLGVALGALSTSTQLTLLPGETTHQTPTDPAALPLPPQDNQPTALGHRANDWLPGRDVQHTELGRGWIVRSMSAQDSPSGTDELHVRFETTNSRSARQRRFPICAPTPLPDRRPLPDRDRTSTSPEDRQAERGGTLIASELP